MRTIRNLCWTMAGPPASRTGTPVGNVLVVKYRTFRRCRLPLCGRWCRDGMGSSSATPIEPFTDSVGRIRVSPPCVKRDLRWKRHARREPPFRRNLTSASYCSAQAILGLWKHPHRNTGLPALVQRPDARKVWVADRAALLLGGTPIRWKIPPPRCRAPRRGPTRWLCPVTHERSSAENSSGAGAFLLGTGNAPSGAILRRPPCP